METFLRRADLGAKFDKGRVVVRSGLRGNFGARMARLLGAFRMEITIFLPLAGLETSDCFVHVDNRNNGTCGRFLTTSFNNGKRFSGWLLLWVKM